MRKVNVTPSLDKNQTLPRTRSFLCINLCRTKNLCKIQLVFNIYVLRNQRITRMNSIFWFRPFLWESSFQLKLDLSKNVAMQGASIISVGVKLCLPLAVLILLGARAFLTFSFSPQNLYRGIKRQNTFKNSAKIGRKQGVTEYQQT